MIVAAAVLVVGLSLAVLAQRGAGAAVAGISWFAPLVNSFLILAAVSVALLAFRRYHVAHDPDSFWIGLGFASFVVATFFNTLWTDAIALQIIALSLLVGGIAMGPDQAVVLRTRWIWVLASWMMLVALMGLIFVTVQPFTRLEGIVGPGLLSLMMVLSASALAVEGAVGTVLSIRRYARSGEVLFGYVALCQLALVGTAVLAPLQPRMHDTWWIAQRSVLGAGFLAVLFGLLAEHLELFQHEPEKGANLQVPEQHDERLIAELERRAAELQATLSSIADGVAIYDSAGNRRYGNAAGERILQSTSEEQATVSLADRLKAIPITTPDGQPIPPEQMPPARALRGERTEGMIMALHRPDREIWISASAAPIYNAEGELFGAIVSFTDITTLHEAEKMMRESEKRYREIFETMQEALIIGEIITDEAGKPVDYRYLDVNPVTAQQYGIPREDFIGHTYWEVIPGGDPEWIEIFGRVALTGEPASLEKYGTMSGRWFESRVYSPRPGQFVSIMTDITERKRAEETLRISEERFAKAFRASPYALIISKLDTSEIVDVNDSFCDVFGYTREEAVGHTALELHVYANPEVRSEVLQQLQDAGHVQDFALEIVRKSGEKRSATLSAELINITDEAHLLTIVNDITERKQAEDALRESEERFRQLADAMPQLVWTARPDGTVDYYNQRHKEYTGIAPGTDGTWAWEPVMFPSDAEATREAWERSVRTGEAYQIEHRIRMADGSYDWHLSRAVLVRDGHGRPVKWFGTTTNIQDLKQTQAELQRYAEELERSNRDLEEFAFVASHDLQEPLRKIEMFSDIVRRRSGNLEPEQIERLQRMHTAAGRMRSMVDGLLQLSRLNSRARPFEAVNLSDLLAEVVSDLESRIKRTGASVEVAPLPTIEADPSQMRRLFQNLITNGLKFQPPGQSPRVSVSATRISPDSVRVTVQDNGIGFNQEEAGRLFQPFHRLVDKNSYEGTGMGLAIARRIVERHHGTIEAYGNEGEGARFVITLPVSQPK